MDRMMLSMVVVLVGCAGSAPQVDNARELAQARETQLARLHEYRMAGEYPIDEQGRPISVFRDSEGRLCPMAHLIQESGRGDLVDQVARENNTLRLHDVHDGPLLAWMETSGLTREEIDMVQGVMEIDYLGLSEQYKHQPLVIEVARGQVDRRIERAERRLRARRDNHMGAGNNVRNND